MMDDMKTKNALKEGLDLNRIRGGLNRMIKSNSRLPGNARPP